MNLLGVIASQNRALVLKVVRQSTIKAEAFGNLFIIAALVLQSFGSRKVHWGSTILSTVAASGVTQCAGSRWGCISGRHMGIIALVGEGGTGSDSVVEFHA
jgi:hypothetical protein